MADSCDFMNTTLQSNTCTEKDGNNNSWSLCYFTSNPTSAVKLGYKCCAILLHEYDLSRWHGQFNCTTWILLRSTLSNRCTWPNENVNECLFWNKILIWISTFFSMIMHNCTVKSTYFAKTNIEKTRIEPVGEPYREVCLSPWKGNWRISENRIDWRNVLLSEKNYFHEKELKENGNMT